MPIIEVSHEELETLIGVCKSELASSKKELKKLNALISLVMADMDEDSESYKEGDNLLMEGNVVALEVFDRLEKMVQRFEASLNA